VNSGGRRRIPRPSGDNGDMRTTPTDPTGAQRWCSPWLGDRWQRWIKSVNDGGFPTAGLRQEARGQRINVARYLAEGERERGKGKR
jgi:hypothetical protein